MSRHWPKSLVKDIQMSFTLTSGFFFICHLCPHHFLLSTFPLFLLLFQAPWLLQKSGKRQASFLVYTSVILSSYWHLHLCLQPALSPLFARSVNHPLLLITAQADTNSLMWNCSFLQNPNRPNVGDGEKHRHSNVNWKPAGWQAQCSVVGMELPSAFWMIGDTVEILWNYLFIGSWAFCRKWLFWKEEKRIPEFSLYLRHALDSCTFSL